ILTEVKRIERNIWLELNNYLTALEQINVLNSMIYSYFNLKGTEVMHQKPEHFLINKMMETRKGNALSIGILYQVLCQRLNIPVYAIGLPRQFILGYFDLLPTLKPEEERMANLKSGILFYVDPTQGQVYTGSDVEVYLKRLKLSAQKRYFYPQSAKSIIRLLLKQLILCFENIENGSYRAADL